MPENSPHTESSGAIVRNIPLLVAAIASITTIVSILVTWFLTERIRTDIAAQTLALERTKADIAAASQQTAELALQLEQARLELDRRIAQSAEVRSNRTMQIEDRRARTDEARLTPDFAKLSNELRPNFTIDCKIERDGAAALLRATCKFQKVDRGRCLYG